MIGELVSAMALKSPRDACRGSKRFRKRFERFNETGRGEAVREACFPVRRFQVNMAA